MTGEQLREIRKQNHWTIEEMAQKSGYCWHQVQRMEKGHTPVSKRMLLFLKLKKLL